MAMITNMTIEELKRWRKEHEFNQQKLADHLGVDIVTVGRWEAGMRKIPPFLHLALKGLEVNLKSEKN
jgi:transcriptional regulator with XRE-family HTH domain